MKEETIVIRVSKELKDKLQKLANADERSRSNYIRIQLKKIADNN